MHYICAPCLAVIMTSFCKGRLATCCVVQELRSQLLSSLAQWRQRVSAVECELAKYKDNDPETVQAMSEREGGACACISWSPCSVVCAFQTREGCHCCRIANLMLSRDPPMLHLRRERR